MHIRVLGSSAGGGLPQWNCGCLQCQTARANPNFGRSQSSLCVSSDGEQWTLLNASPDVRSQLAGFPAIAPRNIRDMRIGSVVLTNADLDHCVGLLILREGGAPPIYCTDRVRVCLTAGLPILAVLAAYGEVQQRCLVLDTWNELANREGKALGIQVFPFAVASKPPPYMLAHPEHLAAHDLMGDTIGVLVRSHTGIMAYVPGVRDLDDRLRGYLSQASVVFIDGTFFTSDEMVALKISTKTSEIMGHAPLSGSSGLIEFLRTLPSQRKIFVHINNTNPILDPSSKERKVVENAGIEVGYDGMALQIE